MKKRFFVSFLDLRKKKVDVSNSLSDEFCHKMSTKSKRSISNDRTIKTNYRRTEISTRKERKRFDSSNRRFVSRSPAESKEDGSSRRQISTEEKSENLREEFRDDRKIFCLV